MKKLSLVLVMLSALVALDARAEAVEWTIDASHSRVGFSVPHMMVSELHGRFHNVTGKVLIDDKKLENSSVSLVIDVNSIDTENEDRDKHLRNPDFFDAQKHPQITFTSTKIRKAGKGYKVSGNLSIRGVKKPITLDVVLSQPVKSPWGKMVRGVKAKGALNRQAFGVSWNKALDVGGVVVGDKVTLEIQMELNK